MQNEWRGLDLSNPDTTTREEFNAFRASEVGIKAFAAPSDDFWWAHDYGVAKRHYLAVQQANSDADRGRDVQNALAALHLYTIVAYEEGILYEARLAHHLGASKGQIVDTLAVAYMHAHGRGMNAAASVTQGYLEAWDSSAENPEAFPAGWAFDPHAFDSGLDFSSPELSDGERELLEGWYVANTGEIPGYARFLLRHRPNLLKAHRGRYETAISRGLPKQMMPYMLLYFNVIRGFRDGIRESVLLGRNCGMSDEQLVTAICRAMTSYGGHDSLSIAYEAAGDVLDVVPES